MPFFKKYIKEIVVLVLIVVNFYIWNLIFLEQDKGLLRVYFLDVGQGDAVFIKSPSGNEMLIDGGSGREILKSLSEVMPFNDRKIDVLVATHPDSDHIGGLVQVLDRFNTDFIIETGLKSESQVYKSFEKNVENSNAQKILAERGMNIDLGKGVKLVVLFPDRDLSGFDSNDASIVAKLYFGNTSFMLTGDSPKKIEEYLVSLDKEMLKSDVLKVGHHGSKTSSLDSFVEIVDSEYAVIQAGRDNKYGHPHQEVLDILESQNIPILGNYDLGTIGFVSDGQEISLLE